MPVYSELTDCDDPRLDVFARLNENQLRHYYEPNGGLFIAESPKVTERALGAGCVPVAALVERSQAEGEAAEEEAPRERVAFRPDDEEEFVDDAPDAFDDDEPLVDGEGGDDESLVDDEEDDDEESLVDDDEEDDSDDDDGDTAEGDDDEDDE